MHLLRCCFIVCTSGFSLSHSLQNYHNFDSICLNNKIIDLLTGSLNGVEQTLWVFVTLLRSYVDACIVKTCRWSYDYF